MDSRLKALVASLDTAVASVLVWLIATVDLRTIVLVCVFTYTINLANQIVNLLPESPEKLSSFYAMLRSFVKRITGK